MILELAKIFSENEWISLDTEHGYLKRVDGEINIVNALSTERNLNSKIYKKFVQSIIQNKDDYSLNVDAQLIVNAKHNFLLLFEFTFSRATCRLPEKRPILLLM